MKTHSRLYLLSDNNKLLIIYYSNKNIVNLNLYSYICLNLQHLVMLHTNADQPSNLKKIYIFETSFL